MNSPRPRIVYIEDDENDVLFLQRAFVKSGLEVDWEILTDGVRAQQCLRSSRCAGADLLILDLNLPLLTGLELLAWWRTYAPDSTVPVAILSSSDNEKDQTRARELGAVGYFLKPISPAGYAVVAQRLARLMHRE